MDAIVITQDNGGQIAPYHDRAAQAARLGQVVRIDGMCGSACTIYLGVPKACITPRATLWFHRVTHRDGSPFPRASAWVMTQYPVALRNWIMAQGGLTERRLVLPYVEARRFVPTCKD